MVQQNYRIAVQNGSQGSRGLILSEFGDGELQDIF